MAKKLFNLDTKEIEQLLFLFQYIEEDAGSLTEKQIKLKRKLERIKKPIKIRSRKNKGSKLQKWVCQQICEVLNKYALIDIKYEQQNDDCLIHSREMGQSGVDIILRGKVKEIFPFSIECKNTERLNLIKTIKQAKNNCQEKTDWVIVYKNKLLNDPIVVIDWETFAMYVGFHIDAKHFMGVL